MASLKSKAVAAALVAAAGLCYQFEGTYLKPYKDPVGIWTDCTGHTGPDVQPGRLNTKAECEAKLQADLLEANATVDRCIQVPLTIGQRAALVDFAFNVGPGGRGVKDGLCYLKSGAVPTIRRKFNTGDYAGGCAELVKWNAQRLRGITKRRIAETTVCLT